MRASLRNSRHRGAGLSGAHKLAKGGPPLEVASEAMHAKSTRGAAVTSGASKPVNRLLQTHYSIDNNNTAVAATDGSQSAMQGTAQAATASLRHVCGKPLTESSVSPESASLQHHLSKQQASKQHSVELAQGGSVAAGCRGNNAQSAPWCKQEGTAGCEVRVGNTLHGARSTRNAGGCTVGNVTPSAACTAAEYQPICKTWAACASAL